MVARRDGDAPHYWRGPCFVVTPKVIQAANRNRLLIHIHGGLWAVSRYVGHGRSDPVAGIGLLSVE